MRQQRYSGSWFHCSTITATLALVWLLNPTVGRAAKGDCGQPLSNGAVPVAVDCLFVLNAAVVFRQCEPVCICDVNGSGDAPNATDALVCLRAAVARLPLTECDCNSATTSTTAPSLPTTSTIAASTTVTSTTTTTLAAGSCPDTTEITWLAAVGRSCVTNAECVVGVCDSGLGRCRTNTQLDMGWTGIAHDFDGNEEQTTLLKLACDATTAPCNVCEVIGIEPPGGDCRCRSDNRIRCDEPFAQDIDDCGGAVCDCYLGPPLAHSAGNLPFCLLHRLGSDITGTINVESGASSLQVGLRQFFYTGEAISVPCPSCSGDLVPRDGIRNGTCLEGANAGQPCDVDAFNTSFPAPGGGGHSLDCLPDPGKNSSGAGLVIDLHVSTGGTSLDANVDCGFPGFAPEKCHCGVCSGNASYACRLNADCAGWGYGECQAQAPGNPRADQCVGASICVADAQGEGTCEGGPTDLFCDGLVRADGRGFVACASNADCDASAIGVDAGNCTLSKLRECFAPTLVASGTPDPVTPLVAGIACVPPTSGAGKNVLIGLPGPLRVRAQQRLRHFCGGLAGIEYLPSSGCALTAAAEEK